MLTGEMRLSEAARGTVALFRPQMERIAAAFGTMLHALEEQLTPPRTIIVRGLRDDFDPWRKLLDAAYLPHASVLFIPSEASGLPPPLEKPATQAVTAWVCEGATCLAPLNSVERLRETLDPRGSPSAQSIAPHRSLS